MGEPRQKGLLTPTRMMEAFHGKEAPLEGVMRLIPQGARGRPLRVGEHRIPTRLLGLDPAPDALRMGCPSGLRHRVDNVAEPLPQRHDAHTLALARPMQQGVEPCAQGLANRGRYGQEFLASIQGSAT